MISKILMLLIITSFSLNAQDVSSAQSAPTSSLQISDKTPQNGTVLWLKTGCIAILNKSSGNNTHEQAMLYISVSNFLAGFYLGADSMAFEILRDKQDVNRYRPRADDASPAALAPIILNYINKLPEELQNDNNQKVGALGVLLHVYYENVIKVRQTNNP